MKVLLDEKLVIVLQNKQKVPFVEGEICSLGKEPVFDLRKTSREGATLGVTVWHVLRQFSLSRG